MFKVSRATLVAVSGLVWLVVGSILLPMGVNFVVEALLKENVSLPHPVLHFLAPYVGGKEQAALMWMGLAILVGFFKGRRLFSKTVQRSVDRILTLPDPVSLRQIYTPGYYLLLGAMMGMGIAVRFLPQDIRGGVDIAIGCALINGAVLYFRHAWSLRRRASI